MLYRTLMSIKLVDYPVYLFLNLLCSICVWAKGHAVHLHILFLSSNLRSIHEVRNNGALALVLIGWRAVLALAE